MGHKKYRIVEIEYGDGCLSYMPQERWLFLWLDMYKPSDSFYVDDALSFGEAKEIIIRDKECSVIRKRVVDRREW